MFYFGYTQIILAIGQEKYSNFKSYSEHGILVPTQLSSWDDQRLFVYFSEELWPEAINRAERDFEDFDEPDRMRLVHERVIDKARVFARVNGVFGAWQQYETKRSIKSHNKANSADAKSRAAD
jgi:hypothetical protein